MRRTIVDLPRPGRPSTNALGLLMRLARWNQLMGSQHTVAPVCRERPMGTPTMGAPAPTANGHSPQTCTLVPRYSSGGVTSRDAPPPRPGQPRGPGRRTVGPPVFFVFFCLFGVSAADRAASPGGEAAPGLGVFFFDSTGVSFG